MIPEDIRHEQLSRHELYFGVPGMQALQNSRVCVVGLGGVGSHAAVMLGRGGIEHLTLIDFDQVTVSSLNRHACATLQHVGTSKVNCVAACLQAIGGGHVRVTAHAEMLTADSVMRLIGDKSHCDWVVDAIDDIPTKAALIAHCVHHKIRVISCMGAGGKSDVTRLHISDLRTASRDPLATKLRHRLKPLLLPMDETSPSSSSASSSSSYLDDMDQLAVVYSSEPTVVKLAELTDEQRVEGVQNFGAVDGMRVRIVPVLGTMPATMGQALAAYTLTNLGHKPFQPVTGERVGRSVRHKCYQHLMRREAKIRDRILQDNDDGKDVRKKDDPPITGVVGDIYIGALQIDHDDVEYLLEVWRNRCAISNARLGTVLELVRWDLSRPATVDNLVLLSVDVIRNYDAHPNNKDWIPLDVQRTIEARLATCRTDR